MKRLILITVILSALVAANASASPWPCDCVGGYNPYTIPTFWYLLDNAGSILQDGDCVCGYWVGPDGLVDGIDVNNPPYALIISEDVYDSLLVPYGEPPVDYCAAIDFGGFALGVTTWGVGDGAHPTPPESIYVVIFDGPCDGLTTSNYYGMSQTHAVENFLGETFYCLFPGDPGFGYTDTPLPVELISFTASGREGEVVLEWVTASETNALGFHVKRGKERITEEIIPAAGNSTIENTYTYVDKDVVNGLTYGYYLITVDIDGVEKVANKEAVLATPMAHLPVAFALHQNFPNPFNPVTEIKYDLAVSAPVTIKIYNVLGAEVATLVDGEKNAGYHSINWDAKDLASGVYFCRITAGDFKAVRKMVFLR